MGQKTEEQAPLFDFAPLLDRYQASLLAFLRGLVADSELARDLAQDVFLDAWRAVARRAAPFSDGSDDADRRRWLFHAAYCRAISARRHAAVVHFESLDGGPGALGERMEAPIQFEEQYAEHEAVLRALAHLSADDAACLLLNVLHGFTAGEIGSILELTPDAAKKRLARAKQRLRAAYLAQNPERQEPTSHVQE